MQTKKMKRMLLTLLLIGLFFFVAGLNGAANPAAAQDDDDAGQDDTAQETVAQDTAQTVWDVIQANEQLSDFEAWIAAAGLAGNLDNDGPFTVFAPTNAAMANFEALATESSTSRTQILLYHIINGRYAGPTLANFSTRPTLLGEEVSISVDAGQISLDDTTDITSADQEASNGVVHIIDTVLLPPDNSILTSDKGSLDMTIDEVLAEDGRFTTFLTLLEQAGMKDDLANDNESYTIFAPTDAAFDKLSEDEVDNWITGQDDIETFVAYHRVNDRLGINQIATDDYIPTAEGRPLFVTTNDDNTMVFINGQPLADYNIVASNGVIHVVDTVLIP